MFTPARYWGAPRKSISRRRDWSNKSRGLPKALKVLKKITPRRNRRRPLNWLRPQNFAEQVLLLVFSMQSPCSCGHFEMRLTYVALSVTKLQVFEEKKLWIIELLICEKLSLAITVHFQQAGARNVELGASSLQEPQRKVSVCEGRIFCLVYRKLPDCHWITLTTHTKWKGNKLPYSAWGWAQQ